MSVRRVYAGSGAGLARDKLLLLLDVGGDQVVKKEERLRIHGDKNVIFKIGDKTAVYMRHTRVIHTWRSLALNVVGLQIHPQTRKSEYNFIGLVVDTLVSVGL